MTRVLVTPSLHASWRWFMDSETSEKQEFLDVLNKVERPPSEAMLLGRKFEEDVFAACNDGYEQSDKPHYDNCVFEAAEHVYGGLWQEKVYFPARVSGYDILLYGKADVIKRDWIYDLKRVKNYDLGKFTGSIQHPVYMHCSSIGNFRYVVTDGNHLWLEDYRFDEDVRQTMLGEIATMLDCIFDHHEFSDAYIANWSARPRRAAA